MEKVFVFQQNVEKTIYQNEKIIELWSTPDMLCEN